MKTMKNTMYVMLITLAFIFSATSCNKDDDGDGGAAASGTVKAKVDGSNYTSNPQLSMASQTTVGSSATVVVQGNDNSGKGIALVINGLTETGTYPIGGGANITVTAAYTEGSASGVNAWQAPFDDTVAGEVKVNEFSATKIVGTFSFTCKNVNGDNSTKAITEGSFNMNF